MKKITFTLITLTLLASSCNKQVEKVPEDPLCTNTLNLFAVRDVTRILDTRDGVDRGVLISLSDIDRLSHHPDSLAVPEFVSSVDYRRWNTGALSEEEWHILRKDMLKREFMILDAEYRKRFLERTGISEIDTVFVYHYAGDVLLAIPVNELNVAAVSRWWPNASQYDFHIGFHKDSLVFCELSSKDRFVYCEVSSVYYYWSLNNALVYVGQTHPFARGGMREIRWERIPAEDFPLEKSTIEADDERILRLLEWEAIRNYDNAYRYKFEHFTLFLQDFARYCGDFWGWRIRAATHLLIIDTRTDSVVVDRLIGAERGSALSDWDWVGRLFRNAPPVALNFSEIHCWFPNSNYCPVIMFLDAKVDDVYIRCDNVTAETVRERNRKSQAMAEK